MNNKKIFFITYYNVHYTQTSQKNDMTFCEGLSENLCNVELIFPNYKFEKADSYDLELDSIFNGYGIRTSFKLNRYTSIIFQIKYILFNWFRDSLYKNYFKF